ncbi:tetratricopeptide repeat protein [Marinoscillum sp.]|uniref:tetratricopeptide repeat protein n=1 Tax=Marinoscillum sp. TaxID=2024838 RepID=UPI003BA91BD1
MTKQLLTTVTLIAALQLSAQDSLRTYYAWSLDAYKQKDFPKFLQYAKRANELRPNHPILAYNIAAAYAVNNHPDKSISALKSYLSMNATMDYMQDMDFISIKDNPQFKALKNYVSDLNKSIETTDSAFSLSQETDHFESIGYNSKSKNFLFGSVTSRSLYSYDDGKLETVVSYEQNPTVYGVMGIDYGLDLIWICTAALPEINDYTDNLKNKSSVLAIHPSSGKVKVQYEVPDAILGDLITTENGLVLASDGLGNKIYSLTKNGAQVYADLSDQLINLQGMAEVDGKLVISDYILGLHLYDPKSQQLTKLDNKGLYSDKGTDGLLYANEALYCFQNGTTPKRTFKITLSDWEVSAVQVIDQNLSDKGEPTQGVLVDSIMYYISNSGWDAYNEGVYEGAPDLVVRSLPVKD